MRAALLLACLAAPAAAWEFTDRPICTLSHATDGAEVTVTYDPAIPEYAIAIRLLDGTWAAGPVFSIAFDGTRPLTIGTDRHAVSDDGTTLTVTDRGFGNVLNGLEFNRTATATSGQSAVTLPLDGAAPAVRAFRGCPAPATS